MEYKSNSNRLKEGSNPEKKVEKVIRGEAKIRKKTDMHKFASLFLAEDIDDLRTFIVMDVVVPAIKNTLLDVAHSLLGGDSGKRSSKASKVSYRDYYEKSKDRKDYRSSGSRATYDYDDIIFDNRGEAEEVLNSMDELIDKYAIVSVADYYDLTGITGSYTDNKYGWTTIQDASVERIRGGGYTIKLPKARPI